MTIPLRWRLVLITTALMAIVLTTIGTVIFIRFRADLIATVDTSLRLRAERIADSDVTAGVTDTAGDPDESFGQVLDPAAGVVESSPGLTSRALLTSAELQDLPRTGQFISTEVATVEEVVPARVLAWPATDGRVFAIGTSIEDQIDATRNLLTLMLTGGVVALLLSAAAGWVVAGFALRPVERMRREADQISGTHQQRLAVPATKDELERLARTLNEMLDRLDSAGEAQRRFITDASHELRTPLTNLKLEVELALREPEAAVASDALTSMREELDRLIALSESLLDLDNSDGRGVRLNLAPTDVVQLVRTRAEAFRSRARSAQIELAMHASASAPAVCDQLRVSQVINNLLDNAIRHAPGHSTVAVSVAATSSDVTVSVADAGPGVPGGGADMFRPFWRADQGNGPGSAQPEGFGLGLSIAKAIVDAHGGQIWAENRAEGGAMVSFTIPTPHQ